MWRPRFWLPRFWLHGTRMKLFTGWHTWDEAEPGLRERLPAETVARLQNAVAFAVEHHGGQRRPMGAPYLEHLLEALEVLVRGAGVTRS